MARIVRRGVPPPPFCLGARPPTSPFCGHSICTGNGLAFPPLPPHTVKALENRACLRGQPRQRRASFETRPSAGLAGCGRSLDFAGRSMAGRPAQRQPGETLRAVGSSLLPLASPARRQCPFLPATVSVARARLRSHIALRALVQAIGCGRERGL